MKYKGKISDPLDLATKQWTESAISTAKSAAISSATSTAAADATTKANNALASAKAYTDSAIITAINASY